MIERIIAALDACRDRHQRQRRPRAVRRFGLPVLPDGAFAGRDRWPGAGGPRLGRRAWRRRLLTVPGDTPFIPRGLAAALAPPPACAASNGRLHQLVALWPVGLP